MALRRGLLALRGRHTLDLYYSTTDFFIIDYLDNKTIRYYSHSDRPFVCHKSSELNKLIAANGDDREWARVSPSAPNERDDNKFVTLDEYEMNMSLR